MRAGGQVCVLILLLGLVSGTTAAQEPDAPLYEVEDPAGDVRPSAPGGVDSPAGIPPGTIADAVDLRALKVVYEDPLQFHVVLEVQDVSSIRRVLDAGRPIQYALAFDMFEPALYLELRANFNGHDLALAAAGAAGAPEPSYRYYTRHETGSCTGSGFDDFEATLLLDENRVLFRVPKVLLLGQAEFDCGFPDQMPATLRAGDEIRSIRAIASSGAGLFVTPVYGFVDAAPDASVTPEPYRFRHSMPNEVLALSSPLAFAEHNPVRDVHEAPDLPSPAAVEIGGGTSLPVVVENRGDRKLLVNLSASVPEEDAADWSVRIVEALEMPANAQRIVAVQVNASEALEHRSRTTVTVRSESLTDPGMLGFVEIPVQATGFPVDTWQALRFHGTMPEESSVGAQALCATLFLGCADRYHIWLNGAETDPAGTADDGIESSPVGFGLSVGGSVGMFYMDAPIDTAPTSPFQFRTEEPAVLRLSLASDRAMEAEVTANLMVGPSRACYEGYCRWRGEVVVATGATSASLGADPATVTIQMAVDPAYATLVPEDGILGLSVRVGDTTPVATGVGSVRFLPRESGLDLPVSVTTTESKSGSGVGLYPQTDRQDYLNPGKTRLFPFLLVNEDKTSRLFSLEASTEAAGWNATLRPGEAYRLEAGASVNATLLVEAPTDAKEGEVAVVTVLARPDGDESSAEARVDFTAIVTRGVELEDQAESYREDPDAAAKAVTLDEGGDSPGLGPVILLMLVVVVANLHRRRPR